MLNKVENFIAENKNDLYHVLFLIVFLLIISIPKLMMQYHIGIGNWDTYLYLENGRNFAKMGWGDVPSISPVLPMILSKLFLIAGHPYQEAIFNVDVVFYILGVLSFYLLLRLKYDEKISVAGSVVFATFTLLYSWVAIGGNDIIGVCGTILTVYLVLAAHKYDNRIYYVALPVAAYAFLSRYTAGVMIFSILFYWIIRKVNRNEIKHILIGGILGVVSVSWFLYQFYIHLGTPFPFLGQFSGTVSNAVVLDSGFLPDSWYYIKHMPNYLISAVPNVDTFNSVVNPMGNIPSLLSYVYIALFVLGLILFVYKLLKCITTSDESLKSHDRVLLAFSLILFVLFLLSLGNVSYIISTVLFFMALYLIWNVFKSYDIEYLDYDLIMISLFVIYLVFQSILFTKNDRYFITVLPFIAYFITYALDMIYSKLDSYEFISKIKISSLVTCILVLVLLTNTLLFVSALPTDNDYENIEEACSWLSGNEKIGNYTILYSDNWPAVTWYLNIYCQRGVTNLTDKYYQAYFSRQLLSTNDTHQAAAYYVDTTNYPKVDYPGLVKIKDFDTVQVYENEYYMKYGQDYIYTKEYNNNIQRDIIEFNGTVSG